MCNHKDNRVSVYMGQAYACATWLMTHDYLKRVTVTHTYWHPIIFMITYEYILTPYYLYDYIWMRMPAIWMSNVTCMNESWIMSHVWHSCKWVMSHKWMSHVTHMNESCHTYEWVMSHIWMSHESWVMCDMSYSCAIIRRLLEIIGLFCKRAL